MQEIEKMENDENLLINGSLVRAQQAEPNNQGLTMTKDGRLVLNLEPGSKPSLFSHLLKALSAVSLERICNKANSGLVLCSAEHKEPRNGGYERSFLGRGA